MNDIRTLDLQVKADIEIARKQLGHLDPLLAKVGSDVDSRLGQIEGRLTGIGRGVAGVGTLLKGTIAGFLAGVSIEAVTGAARAVMDFADNIDAASERVGIGAERFQTLRAGLRSLEVDAGRQQQIFDRLFTTLGNAQQGTTSKSVETVLERMGIAARIANGEISTTDELLDAVAQAATRYTTQAQFAADVSVLVGRKAGPELAAALADGGGALKTAEQSFRDTGAVIDEEMIKKLAAANETWDAFLEQSRSRTVIWAGEMIGYFQSVGTTITDSLRGRGLLTDEKGLIGALLTSDEETIARGRQNREIMAILGTPNRGQNGLPGFDRPAQAPAPRRTGGTGGGRGTSAARPASLSWAEQVRRGDFDTPITNDPMASLRETQLPEARADIEKIYTALRDAGELPPIEVFDSDAIAMGKDFTGSILSDLSMAIAYGDNLGDVLENTFRRMGAAAIQNGLASLLGLDRQGGGGGGFFGAIGGFLGGLFGGFREAGGPVRAGRSYVTGERGPEVIVPSSDGFVINNALMRAAAGQGGMGGTLRIEVVGSEDFNVRVARVGANAGQSAALDVVRVAQRPSLGGGLG